jgi:DNA primase
VIDLDAVREFVFEHFPKVKVTKGGTHFNARCILCGDSKKSLSKRRFNLNYNNGNPIYQCFNCGESGSFIDLYATIKGIDYSEARRILLDYSPNTFDETMDRIGDRWNGIKKVNTEEPLTKYHDYILKHCVSPEDNPKSYITKRLQQELFKFIKERHIPNHVKLYVAYEETYKNRIIIPIFENQRIVYFQARSIHKHVYPKYKNPASEKERIILNKEKFNPDKYIIVTEGLLDAFMIPDQGTACLGSSISTSFLKELFLTKPKGIIIFFDNDESGIEAFRKFTGTGKYKEYFGNEYKKEVKYFVFPDKYKRENIEDLNEIVSKYEIDNVYDFVVENSYSLERALVRLQLGGFVK